MMALPHSLLYYSLIYCSGTVKGRLSHVEGDWWRRDTSCIDKHGCYPALHLQSKAAGLRMGTAFIFCGLCFLIGTFITFSLPEMKDRNMEVNDHVFVLKLPAREFSDWRGEDERQICVRCKRTLLYNKQTSSTM